MPVHSIIDPTLPLDLGNGLILRQATSGDADVLADFNSEIHRNPGEAEPDYGVGFWTRDLMRGDHPTMAPGDFTIIEDQRTGAIVSSMNLISQTWSYDGIPFGVGRPEMVGTHPDYRKRGLVRAQFEVIHRWSAERGHKMQAITGIPYYYRQFGYEMAVALDTIRAGYIPAHIPTLKAGQPEPYTIRPAVDADLPFIAALYEQAMKRYPLACIRDAAIWRHELHGHHEKSDHFRQWCAIESSSGELVGYMAYATRIIRSTVYCTAYELKPGVSWLAATPSVLRYLAVVGKTCAELEHKELAAFALMLGETHPTYDVSRSRLPFAPPPYAWYVRVPDLADFLRHITPALNRRLANSVAVGHTGELKISFYRNGLRLLFENGCLKTIDSWMPTHDDGGSAAFAGHTFLQVLFGHRTPEELRTAFPDCWVGSDEARVLLTALFPRQPSYVWPVA